MRGFILLLLTVSSLKASLKDNFMMIYTSHQSGSRLSYKEVKKRGKKLFAIWEKIRKEEEGDEKFAEAYRELHIPDLNKRFEKRNKEPLAEKEEEFYWFITDQGCTFFERMQLFDANKERKISKLKKVTALFVACGIPYVSGPDPDTEKEYKPPILVRRNQIKQ